MKTLNRIEKACHWAEKIICFVTLFVVLGAELWQMFTRIVLHVASPGMEEVMRYVQIWMCWIGATYALSIGAWPGMDILDSLVEKAKHRKQIMNMARLSELLVSLGFICWFMYVYYTYYFNNIVNAPNYSSVLHIHLKWIMGAIVVALPLMALHMVIKTIRGDWKWEPEEPVESIMGQETQE